MRTRVAVAGGVIASLLALAGCGGGSSFDGGGESDGTLRMLVNVTPNLTLTFWRDLVKPFEDANPGTEVKIEAPGAAGVAGTLTTLLAAGTEPDIAEGAKQDVILDKLSPLDEDWATSAPMADKLAVDGKSYSVPVGVQPQSLIYYNKTAFQKAGITAAPSTLDELTADMAKLKDAGFIPLQTAGDTWVTGGQVRMLSAPQIGAAFPNWYKDVNAGKAKPSDGYGPVVSRYEGWIRKGYVPKDALGIKYADGEAAFLKGKAAMYPMGSWFVAAEAAATKDFQVGVFAIPGEKTGAPLAATPAGNYVIFKSSKKQEQARKLVQYLTQNKDAVTTQMKGDGIYRTGFDYELSPLSGEVQGLLNKATTLVASGEGFGPNRLPTGFDAEFHTQVQKLYIGKSASEVLATMDAWIAAQTK
jgi:multiple sugar transport system substrate-binding protein/raffinose/stachyose/melibiose transport system substrate-binding protein